MIPGRVWGGWVAREREVFLPENIIFLRKLTFFEKKIACSTNLKKNYQKKNYQYI
jgi:hypothetical protein